MDSVTEAYKNKIGERLTRKLAQAVKGGQITPEELPNISSYILTNIDNAKTNSELLTFLEEVASKWPIFSETLTIEQSQNAEDNKEEKVEQITSLIDANKLDEALQIATDTNSQMAGGRN
jgi:hypothetical protein